MIKISFVTLTEIKKKIKININPTKTPGFVVIIGQILKELPRKPLIKTTNPINTSFRLQYMLQLCKVTEIVMIPKESHISEGYFEIKQDNAYSDLKIIHADVPQGSKMGPAAQCRLA